MASKSRAWNIYRFPSVLLLTLFIIIVQLATYFWGNGPTDPDTARRFGAIQTGDTAPNEWFRLVTYIFVQIGGTSHLVSNLIFLIILGIPLERVYGSAKFILLFLVTGIAAGICILFFTDHVIAAGASGSIFGLMGLYIGLMIKRNDKIDLESNRFIWIVIIANLLYTFLAPGVAIPAHLGGLISGIVFAYTGTTRKLSNVHRDDPKFAEK